MKKAILLFLGLVAMSASAQQINIHLPRHPYKALTVTLRSGTGNDTIYHNFMDDKGNARIVVPESHRGYRGMATLKTGDYAIFDFIIAGEDFTLTCNEDYPYGSNVTFMNSPENESLQKWFYEQYTRQEKIMALGEALRFYPEEESFHLPLKSEKQRLDRQQQQFEDMLDKSKLYAARFISLHNFLGHKVGGLVMADSASMSQTRLYLTDSLDINSLYTSGLWFDVLNGSLALYDEHTPYHSDFINDMSKLLSRSGDKVYTTLAENLFAICETTGWNDLEEQLAYYLINDGRVVNPTGKLKMLMTLFKLGKGSKAPGISFGALPQGKVLLVFYESGCNACDNEIQQLKGNYSLLKERGYEVVSVSADTDADIFRNTSGSFPWKARYCDLQGLSGTDFRNFGVIGTPTFYVLDKDGIVQGRYARLEDTGIIK